MRHYKLTHEQGIHGIVALEYSNATARMTATGFVSTDVGKLAIQGDSGELYRLSNITPTWVLLAGSDPALTSALSTHYVGLAEHGISSFGASVVSAASAGQLRDTLGLSVVATASASTVAVGGVVPLTTSSGFISASFEATRGRRHLASVAQFGIPDPTVQPYARIETLTFRDSIFLLPFTVEKDIRVTGARCDLALTPSPVSFAFGLYSCQRVPMPEFVSATTIMAGYTNFQFVGEIARDYTTVPMNYVSSGASLFLQKGNSYAISGMFRSTNFPTARMFTFFRSGEQHETPIANSSKTSGVFYFTAVQPGDGQFPTSIASTFEAAGAFSTTPIKRTPFIISWEEV